MDLNGDGRADILSGSYSRMGGSMAGLFQVLWGTEEGGFEKAKVLNGTDDKPLIIPASDQDMILKICTRPTAADIDGDGHLDLVVGNFSGTFYTFKGEGKGAFAPEAVVLTAGSGDDAKGLHVPHHSDPFLVDWDRDGDLDLLSGSSAGGVFISINNGSKTSPEFSKMEPLIPGLKARTQAVAFGDAHIKGPQGSTRIWVDDVNGDGKLDVLVGDSYQVQFAGEGLTDDEAREKLMKFNKEQEIVYKEMDKIQTEITKAMAAAKKAAKKGADETFTKGEAADSDKKKASDDSAESKESDAEKAELDPLEDAKKRSQETMKKLQAMFKQQSKIVRSESRGTVWVYYQK